jgi:nucleoside-diphosphate-sugar epimerase
LPFAYTIIRPSAVYGPRDVDFLALFKQLKSGLGIYPGNRDSYVSAIYVEDLVNGILEAALHESASNQTYFLTREISLTWQHIYHIMADIWKNKLREINLPFGLVVVAGHLGDLYSKVTGRVTVMNSKKIDLARPRYWVCSAEKAMTDFGFSPQTKIEQGLQQTFNWYKTAGWL